MMSYDVLWSFLLEGGLLESLTYLDGDRISVLTVRLVGWCSHSEGVGEWVLIFCRFFGGGCRRLGEDE